MTITRRRFWQGLAVAVLAVCLGVGGCKTTPPDESEKPKPGPAATGPHASLVKLFPGDQDVSDWKSAGPAEVFGPVADAANGVEAVEKDAGADAGIYRSYEYHKSAVREYARGAADENVTLRIAEMASPSEAFGLFSVRSTGGQFPLVGLAARMSNRALGFVKGACFVSVEYRGTKDATPVLMEFGRWVADQITSPGYKPAMFESFPLGSVQGERYYLHTFETLAGLPFVPKGDPVLMGSRLALSQNTNVAIMGYPTDRPGVLNYLFAIRYPTEGDAASAYTQYETYLMNSTTPAEQDVAVSSPIGSYMAGTFSAEENSVNDRLARLLAGLGG